MSDNDTVRERGAALLLLNRILSVLLIVALTWLASSRAALADMGQSVRPRLVLLFVIDQFAYDYLARYHDKFGPSGFRFLQESGAAFSNCRYKQATTQTAVGHSVIATGAYPWASGVVANAWFDRRRNAEIPAVFDETVQLVGGNGQGASAKAMNGTTFGDQLKLSTNGRSKVMTVSLKDRSALMLAGKMANGAFWFDARTGAMVSSSQFGSTLPAWVTKFNDVHYADQYFGKAWQRMLPETEYVASSRDDYQFEGSLPGDGRVFPHVITGGATSAGEQFYGAFEITPWANQMLLDFAHNAVVNEKLGQHADPDMLAISLSSTDMVGHMFGPYSQEAEDMMLRLDQQLASFLSFLNQQVGLEHCVIAVTGDHGAQPIPEFLKEHAQGREVDAGRIDPRAFKTTLDTALDNRLGQEDWIQSVVPPNVYLNLEAIDKEKYRQPEVEALAAKIAHSISGVADVYTAAQFYTNQLPSGPFIDNVRRSYYWGRSGELYVVPKPGYVWMGAQTGTSHGSPYAYDAQVPLLLYGGAIQAGQYGNEASPADIAPTLSALVGITMPPLCEGRVLTEAMRQLMGPPAPFRAPATQQANLNNSTR